jgi:hypothetical protein
MTAARIWGCLILVLACLPGLGIAKPSGEYIDSQIDLADCDGRPALAFMAWRPFRPFDYSKLGSPSADHYEYNMLALALGRSSLPNGIHDWTIAACPSAGGVFYLDDEPTTGVQLVSDKGNLGAVADYWYSADDDSYSKSWLLWASWPAVLQQRRSPVASDISQHLWQQQNLTAGSLQHKAFVICDAWRDPATGLHYSDGKARLLFAYAKQPLAQTEPDWDVTTIDYRGWISNPCAIVYEDTILVCYMVGKDQSANRYLILMAGSLQSNGSVSWRKIPLPRLRPRTCERAQMCVANDRVYIAWRDYYYFHDRLLLLSCAWDSLQGKPGWQRPIVVEDSSADLFGLAACGNRIYILYPKKLDQSDSDWWASYNDPNGIDSWLVLASTSAMPPKSPQDWMRVCFPCKHGRTAALAIIDGKPAFVYDTSRPGAILYASTDNPAPGKAADWRVSPVYYGLDSSSFSKSRGGWGITSAPAPPEGAAWRPHQPIDDMAPREAPRAASVRAVALNLILVLCAVLIILALVVITRKRAKHRAKM